MLSMHFMLWLWPASLLSIGSAAPAWSGSNTYTWPASLPTAIHTWPHSAPIWYTSSTTVPVVTSSTTFTASGSVSTSQPSSTAEPACATVRSLAAASTAKVPQIPASVAWNCLQSVPLNATAAVPWLESLKPYFGWQTTLSYLKNPPSGYLEPAVDVYGELDSMIANVDQYATEYDLEFALYRIFQTTHDGHFRYLPTLMSGVLTFGRPIAVVSVSSDGYALPEPYVYSDILAQAADASLSISAIKSINGQDAIAYLENLSQYGSLQDPDALYNNVMYNLAQVSLGTTGSGAGTFAGGGRGAYLYPDAETVLTFANGTSATYQNFARVLQDFTNITTGEDIYEQFLTPPLPTETTSTSTPPSTPTPAPGYPSPIVRQINNLIGGYYLSDPEYSEVAVLSVPSFVGLQSAEESFQQVALDFIAQSKADGKTKLVIDVSANAGGTILQGYNLFTNLFPDLVPYGATRFRAHQAFDLMGQVVSSVAGPDYPWNLTNPPGPDDVLNDFLGIPFDYRADVDVNGQNFVSWSEKYGPHEYNGDNFTSIIRWNLSDPTTIYTSGLIVDGYQNRTNIVPAQPYAAEDIVILYDGYCASTCTIFSEFMRQQAGVKTIVIGGRPQSGQMQAVGGVKGTNDWDWQEVYVLANDTFALASPEELPMLQNSELALYTDLPFIRSTDNDGYLNVRDGIRQGDETETPLQFIYEAADCRIFYEPTMVVEVEAMWERTVDVAWGGQACVEGAVGLSKRAYSQKKQRARRSVSESNIQGLREGVSLFTDLRGKKVVGDGFMLP